jgi:hypothetical protein
VILVELNGLDRWIAHEERASLKPLQNELIKASILFGRETCPDLAEIFGSSPLLLVPPLSMPDAAQVDIIDRRTGRRIHHLENIEYMSISPNGQLVLGEDASGDIRIWNLQRQKAEFTVATDPSHIAWVPRGDLFAARECHRSAVKLWRAEPYPHVSYQPDLAIDIVLGVSRILHREGYLADEVGVETNLGRHGDRYFLALALPGDAYSDPVLQESLRDKLGALIAKDVLADGLTILFCTIDLSCSVR